MPVISVKKVPDYDENAVYEAVCAHFAALGVERDLRPGMRILIKPNLLSGDKPEKAVTTHHTVVSAVVRWLKERGMTAITVADSSSGIYTEEHMRSVYHLSGLDKPDLVPYLNHDFTFRAVETPPGFTVRAFNLITPAADADYIINLAKLKTHSMTTMSAGVKNLFGTIPGLQKPDMHYRYPNLADFTHMLCELALTVKPAVTLLDAVVSMEGNGPGGGTPKKTGLTLASRDPFALDAAAARFMGLDPDTVPHLMAARKLGVLPDELAFTGDELAPCPVPFVMPDAVQSVTFADMFPAFIRGPAVKLANALLRSYPSVDRAKCVGCGKCAESCPQHIITVTGGKASMPRRGCISCFCCQEMCRFGAISAKRVLKM